MTTKRALAVPAIVLSFLLVALPLEAEDPVTGAPVMKDVALRLSQEQDTFASIEYLAKQSDALKVTKTFGELMHHFYWKEKDLFRSIAFGRAGLQYGLTASQALQESAPQQAADLRSAAKALAYDLASFTWTGWNEPEIVITDHDLQLGLDAAIVNLRLARELKKDALPLSRAYWILGGHQLAARKYPEALQAFQGASQQAKLAANASEELLAQGFEQIVEIVRSKGTSGMKNLNDLKGKLKPLPDGEFFVGQIDTALKVFSK